MGGKREGQIKNDTDFAWRPHRGIAFSPNFPRAVYRSSAGGKKIKR
jgi:hypothetical protein